MKTIYEWTGEYRPPKKGEWFASKITNKPTKAEINFTVEFWILRPRQIDEVESE